ncbi:ets DNA-binding protein pokkuri-like [Paramacrobiotus metropolitanus]|uniref:ets DNA-binding protein pokkuri-like n=1 Tax=Paramacrobiotus metropolitanus TaxID=2943436 RepID=UPI002445FE94|nr:ets DNA-binding protein pokkuri-like [Paramacrobiotus metropolitanus]
MVFTENPFIFGDNNGITWVPASRFPFTIPADLDRRLQNGINVKYDMEFNRYPSRNPAFWSREDVQRWITSCIREYGLTDVNPDNFALSGKALCILTRSDFLTRCPSAGDVLYNTLIAYASSGSFSPAHIPSTPPSSPHDLQPSPTFFTNKFPHFRYLSLDAALSSDTDSTSSGSRPSTPTSSPAGSMFQSAFPSAHPLHVSTAAAPERVRGQGPAGECRLLWEFIYVLLEDPVGRYEKVIRWKDRGALIFHIVDPGSLAVLWGVQKKHAAMNFEKLARALRYYYRMDILRKEPGERHCYRFTKCLAELRHCRFANKEK